MVCELKPIRSRFILNPFFWFDFVWALILLIHSLGITTLYPALPTSFLVFFVTILILGVVFGKIYDTRYLKVHCDVLIKNDKPSWILTLVCFISFILEVAYSRMIPLIEVFHGNTSSYANFGIPHFTFAAVSLTLALDAITSVKFFFGQQHKASNLLILLFCYSIFILSYSRGILIFSLLISLVVLVSKIRFSFKVLIALIILAVIGSLIFNILGNIRQHAAWNDSSFIMTLAGFDPRYNFLKSFSWVITYVDTPLGNLCYLYYHVTPEGSLTGLASQLIPDFLAKRILPSYNATIPLSSDGLTASSMFAGLYKYFGLPGMFLGYAEMVLVFFVSAHITRNNTQYFLATSAGLSMIAAMSFFANMVTYSGYSFFLFFIFFGRLISGKDKTDYAINYVKALLAADPAFFENRI